MRRSPTPGRFRPSALLLAALVLAPAADAAVIVVTDAGDPGTAATCTLRQAVQAANTDTPVGTCASGAGADTVRLGGLAIGLTLGQVQVTTDIAFDGAGATITAAPAARALLITGAITVSIEQVSFQNGAETVGGAIAIVHSDVTVKGGRFVNNLAQLSGGGIHIHGATGGLTLQDVTFERNRARGTLPTEGGGAVYTDARPVSTDACTFLDNRAIGTQGSGGAISNPFGAQLIVFDSVFKGNRAQRAGGAIETVDNTTRIVDTDFSDNTAGPNPGNGGAIHGGGSVGLFVTKTGGGPGGDLTGNAAASEGGGLWISGGGTLSVDGAVIDGNTAGGAAADQGGGGIYSNGGAVTITGASITNNRATGPSGSGGGLFVNGGTADVGASSTISGNRSNRAGGGIEVTSPDPSATTLVTLTNVAMSANATGSNPGNGGGIHTTAGPVLLTLTDVTVSDNVARREGGGIWIGGGTTLQATGVSLRSNRALGPLPDDGGGGLFVSGGDAVYTDGAIVGNQANGAEGSGGGLFALGGTVRIERTQVLQNTARRAGGGIEVVGATVDVVDATSLSGNRAGSTPGNGGGIHVGDGAVSVDGSDLHDNEARNEGGGLWNSAAGTLTVTRTTLENNRAAFGGGMFQQGDPALTGGFTVRESLLHGNRARQQGGGIYASAGATGRVDNATLYANVARFGGGGWTDNADVDFESATLAQNRANVGGGLFNADPNTRPVQLANTIVADNVAGSDPDLRGRYASGGYNVIGTAVPVVTFPPTTSDQIGVSPLLGPLAANGGPTLTAALGAGSPAIDAGSSAHGVDQRGYIRADGSDDVGAYEFGALPLTAPAQPARLAEPMAEPVALAVVPNPLSGRAQTTFAVREAQAVTVAVFDVVGRRVQDLFAGPVEAEAPMTVSLDGGALAAGVYVVVVQSETARTAQMVTVVR